MRPIQMVDTQTQYHKIKKEVDSAVLQVMESSAFINGKPVRDFATHLSSYLGVKHTIPCGNGTDALQIAMMALNLQTGDQVIIPSFNYIAAAEAAVLLGLTPVFVEVDPKTFCMDPLAFEKAITARTKAVVPVHLYGQAADMEKIMVIAKKHGVFVIEDNAQATGCDYIFSDGAIKKTGTIGHIGTTSFHPSKNLGAFGDGGAIFTDDDKLAVKLQMITNHGQSGQKFYHQVLGCNSRLDTIQAAILAIKLRHLDEYTAARNKTAAAYDKALENCSQIKTPYRAPYSKHVFNQYTLLAEDRDGLNKFLAGNGIPSKVYYPLPGHRQKMTEPLHLDAVSLPVTDDLTRKVISLPMHTELGEEEIFFITNKVLEYFSH